MLNPGFVTRKALAQWQDVPAFLPQFQFHEKHRTVIHTAHPEHILPFIANFDVRQDVVIRRLMFLRQLPQKFLRNQQANSIGNFGLHSFTLLKNSASELCYGLRGQFWRSDFGLEKVPDVSAFQTSVVARRNFSHRNALNYAPQQESEKQLLRTVQIKTPRCLSHSNDEAGNLR